jgi:hypothetical protein
MYAAPTTGLEGVPALQWFDPLPGLATGMYVG